MTLFSVTSLRLGLAIVMQLLNPKNYLGNIVKGQLTVTFSAFSLGKFPYFLRKYKESKNTIAEC
jgi:hypothetical protein